MSREVIASSGTNLDQIRAERVAQFRQDRWRAVAGFAIAGPTLVALSWNAADHRQLIYFAIVHHVSVWVLALTYFAWPMRNTGRQPIAPYLGLFLVTGTLSSALWFDTDAGEAFAASTATTLFACVGGALATLGAQPQRFRAVGMTGTLVPYALSAFVLGYNRLGIAAVLFYLFAIEGVARVGRSQDELVTLRLAAATRAASAEHAARTDPLTGLLNRHGLIEHDGTPTQSGASVLFIDVNDFKAVNDQHGHDAGDRVLQFIAQRLVACARKNDIVARLGGDEFIVLCLDDDTATATSLASRITASLAAPFPIGSDQHVSCTASIGIAHTEKAVLDLGPLLHASDQAMYAAKNPHVANER